MIGSPSGKKAFLYAITLHLFLIGMLLIDSTAKRPTLTAESKNTPGMQQSIARTPQQEPIKAVSVDSKQVMATVEHLKQERRLQQQMELNRQNELNKQAQLAKQQRMKEQQYLAKLKEEANKIAIKRKEEEKKHQQELKKMAEQKVLEAKRLEELKKQKQVRELEEKKAEERKLAALQEAKFKAEKQKAEQASQMRADKAAAAALQAKAESERKLQAAAAAQQALAEAQTQAHIAGEVDKYKALIVNAIGRNWILPEHVDSGLSSQFRIRLAPDGAVLAVSLIRSSGDPLLDRSAQTAIYKASPLPVPTSAETFRLFRDISLTVRPEQVRG